MPATMEDMSMRPKLYDWQDAHADNLTDAIRLYGSALDASDTGIGKTIIALEVAARLEKIPFVLCPKAVIPSWQKWMKEFQPEAPMHFCETYEKMRGGKTKYLARNKKSFDWRLRPDISLLIFDEVHRCKSDKSLNARMLAYAKDAKIPVLMLSATACGNPKEMRAIGYHLGLHGWNNWWNWCLRTGCRKGRFGGLDFKNEPKVLKKLHDHIFPARGSRIRIKELPEGTFPDNMVIPEGYRVNDPKALDAVWAEMADELKVLAETKADDDPDSPLTLQIRARQETELMKVPTFVELVRDGIEEGNSVVLFVNYKATRDAIISRMSTILASGADQWSVVQGGQTEDERQAEIDKFQSNKSKFCLCMMQAGGVGLSLHDTEGDHPRLALISPSYSAIDLRQTLGRIHRSGGKTPAVQKIVFAADTVEMRVCTAIRKKLKNLDLINDDELNPVL